VKRPLKPWNGLGSLCQWRQGLGEKRWEIFQAGKCAVLRKGVLRLCERRSLSRTQPAGCRAAEKGGPSGGAAVGDKAVRRSGWPHAFQALDPRDLKQYQAFSSDHRCLAVPALRLQLAV